MKKTFITCLTILSLSVTIKAQDSVKVAATKPSFKVLELGFRFMPTFSAFDMTTSSGGTVKGEVTLGYGIGGLLAINLTNHVGIQGELIYNSLSQKYKDQDLDREINVRYINIPLMLSLNTGKSNPVNLNLVCGPQLGMNVGSSMKVSGSANSDTLTTVFAAKRSDIGFAYGAGLGFILNANKTIRLDMGYRGVYGFANISNTSQTTSTTSNILDRAKVRTHSAYIGFTLLF